MLISAFILVLFFFIWLIDEAPIGVFKIRPSELQYNNGKLAAMQAQWSKLVFFFFDPFS